MRRSRRRKTRPRAGCCEPGRDPASVSTPPARRDGLKVATVAALRSSAAAVSYYESDGYYAKNDPEHRQASFWHGEGAAALGLRAHVRPSRFESVLSGFVPGTHAIRRQTNEAVREGLADEGVLHGRALAVDRLVNRRLTRAQASDTLDEHGAADPALPARYGNLVAGRRSAYLDVQVLLHDAVEDIAAADPDAHRD